MIKLKACGLFCLLLVGLSYSLWESNYYMRYKLYTVQVIDKTLLVTGKYGRQTTYIVYKTGGVVFDTPVSISTYAKSNIGDVYNISIRPIDIKQTTKENILFFFLPVVMYSFTIVCVLAFLIHIITLFLRRSLNEEAKFQ